MKKILVLAVLMMGLMACRQNEPKQNVVGEYEYHFSGVARIFDYEAKTDTVVSLTPENGALKIFRDNETLMGVFYPDGGGFFSANVSADEKSVYFSNSVREIRVDGKDYQVLFSGDALLNERGFYGVCVYSGNLLGDYNISIVSQKLELIAERKQ